MPEDSCRWGGLGPCLWAGHRGGASGQGSWAGQLGGAAGGAGGWQLPSSTKSLMLESLCTTQHQDIVGEDGLCRVGAGGPLVHRHFFQHVPPAPGRLGILACLLATRGRREPPSHCKASPTTPFVV